MKALFIVTMTLSLFSSTVLATTTSSRTDIKISMEDLVQELVKDVDGNDVSFCSNYNWQSDAEDNTVNRLTISLTAVAAGAIYQNALYFQNPCNGSAEIELKAF